MHRNWKFHVIAISIICGIVFILYALIGPGAKKTVVIHQETDRFIQIYSATWGQNCNPYIAQENAFRQQLRLQPQRLEQLPPEERPDSLDPLPMVSHDNVLISVGERCNGQVTCSFDATSENVEHEPLASCFKHLKIDYRCFTVDRLRSVSLGQSETLTIDCNESATETAQ